jgi:DNA glycosylase AlkZ-like
VDGKQYWFDASTPSDRLRSKKCIAHLLPNLDEYAVTYRDRSALQSDLDSEQPLAPKLLSFGNILSNVVIVDGVVRGAWRTTMAGNKVQVEVRLSDRSVDLVLLS